MKVRDQLQMLVKSHLTLSKLYGESNVRGTLTRLGVKITPSGDPVANTNTDSGQAHRVTFEDGGEELLTCMQIFQMMKDGQGTSSASVYDWVANAKASGVVHETLQDLGIMKIEEGHGMDSPKHGGTKVTVRIINPDNPGTSETMSFASQRAAGSFVLKRATLCETLSLQALLKRMRENGEFKDDNSVKFTMESVENKSKRTAIPVYAIVVKDEICSKGMDLVKKHVASWDEHLPEFVLEVKPEHYKVIDNKLARNESFENVRAGFANRSLVCLTFDGYTKGDTCVHDFLKNVMMLGENDARNISGSMQKDGRTPRTDAWCRLVFTEDAFLNDLTKTTDNSKNQDRVWFLYRAFVIAKMSDDSVPAEDVIKRMLGDKMHTNLSEQDPSYRVLSENAEWVSHEYTVQWPSKGSDIKKLSLNDVIARGVWRTLSLAGKHPKKPSNKKGTTQWVKVAAEAKAVGTGNTTKVLYLEYGKQIPDNVEEIPFMYLPLTDAYLPKSPRPDSCAGKDVYLVFVAQRREQRIGK